MSQPSALPDLLRRFVATPLRFGAVLHSTPIAFETNDGELLSTFRSRAERLAIALTSCANKPWVWKIIRDNDIPEEDHQAYLLSGETLSALFLGTHTAVAIDWERGELLGFVSTDVSASHLVDILIEAAQQRHQSHDYRCLGKPRCASIST